MDMSQTAETQAGSSLAPQLPWASIPKFTPGVTNVQEYTQKMKFLAAMWPSESLPLLAPRAALMVEGTAFRKIARLDPAKLKSTTTAGVALLVETIGGSWGSTEIEERYEYFEKALYGTVQRPDESHDSFLARMENNFVELISRNTTLEEVQAYVLLRQSTLLADDKKRILLEHQGDLKYKPVVKAFRLLGSKFFNEFQSGKAASKTKVYDVNFTEENEPISAMSNVSEPASAFQASVDDADGEIDGEYLEALVASEDPDAMLVASFESELEEFMQDVPGMCEAMTTYVEARAKLLEKKKGRGFWPIKGGGKSKFGKSRGRGGGKGKSARDRENLLARIARSHCRVCGQLGHWKAECPSRQQSESSKSASANLVTVATVPEPSHQALLTSEAFSDSEAFEVFSEPDAEVYVSQEGDDSNVSCFHRLAVTSLSHRFVDQSCDVSFAPFCEDALVVQELFEESHQMKLRDRIHQFRLRNAQWFPHQVHVCQDSQEPSAQFVHPRLKTPVLIDHPALRVFRQWKAPKAECLPHECLAASCDKPCHAILDTGASRCIIGEKILQQLRQHLPSEIDSQVKQVPSSVTFRFGNNQSLTSSYRIQIPLLRHDSTSRKLWLAIEVVPGSTPFLFSKKAFKQLGGILDTTKDQCTLQRLNRVFSLEHSKTDLYLLDITKLCSPENPSSEVFQAVHVGNIKSSWGFKDVFDGKEHVSAVLKTPKSKSFPFPKVDHQNALHVRKFVSSRGKPFSASCNPDRSIGNASESNVDQFEERVRVHDRIIDSVTSSFGSPTGESAVDRRQRRASECRSDPDHEHHAARVAEPEASSSRSGGQSDEAGGTSNCTINGGFKPTGSSFEPNSGNTNTCPTTCVEQHVGQSCSPRSSCPSFSNARKSSSINLDSGRRGGRVRRDAHSRSCSNSISLRQHSDSNSTVDSSGERGGMGNDGDHMGQEAQRQDLSRSLSQRHRLLPLVSGKVPKFASQSAGLCALLSSSPGDREPQLSGPANSCSSSFRDVIDSSFHLEVQLTREQLSSQNQPSISKDALSQSYDAAEGLIEQVFHTAKLSRPRSQIKLLEVYAGSHSPLVEAVRSLGFKAMRFSKEDGDLSTVAGRKKLWELIDCFQPEHIWVAPECRPWGGWSRLNQFKSVKLFDQITEDRHEQLQHVKLCASLCKYQQARCRHFHLEQPLGSHMPKLPEFQSICEFTQAVHVDMCAFGLKIPGTQRFLKKGSQIHSSDPSLRSVLFGSRCPKNHEHQTIEGSLERSTNFTDAILCFVLQRFRISSSQDHLPKIERSFCQ